MMSPIWPMAFLSLLVGGILAITPYLMPPTECFTVTVPPSAKQDPRIRRIYHRYTLAVAASSIAGTAILLAFATAEQLDAFVLVSVFCPLVVSFAAMLVARAQVRTLKEQEGWTAEERRAAAFVADDTLPQPISLAWNLLFLVPAAGSALVALLEYDRFPDRIPMQTGLDGVVTSYADKSPVTVLFPAIITAFMGALFTLCHWMTIRSKRPVDPAAPATSALAYGRFARAQSIMLLAGGLLICTAIGVVFDLTSLGVLPLSSAGAIMIGVVAVFLVAMLWLAVAYGQSGARLAAELRGGDELAQDDDAYWILGGIYCNPDDPSFSVPKRFGVGWTINIGSRSGQLVAALIVFALVALALGMMLTSGV